MSRIEITRENTEAEGLLPPAEPDGSNIGVNYTDAYVKAMNVELADGRKVSCKRKGLRITLQVGDASGDGLMRRIEHGPDPKAILRQALETAAQEAGFRFVVDAETIYLEEVES